MDDFKEVLIIVAILCFLHGRRSGQWHFVFDLLDAAHAVDDIRMDESGQITLFESTGQMIMELLDIEADQFRKLLDAWKKRRFI